jgi:uncharacterized membrane protein YcaP (DUF421 family)
MLIVFFRALILFSILFLVIRLMGKRELSKVQPFELAIIIIISDLASAPMSSHGSSIFDGIIPIITLLIMYILFTLLIQSDKKIQDIMCGEISPIIVDGKIVESEFSKQQYTIPDIMSQLRQKDVFKIQDVKYAIVETNGNLSVIKDTDVKVYNSIPLNIIEEGQISKTNIKILKLSTEDVEEILRKNNLNVSDVLIGTLDENSKFIYQLKDGVKSC